MFIHAESGHPFKAADRPRHMVSLHLPEVGLGDTEPREFFATATDDYRGQRYTVRSQPDNRPMRERSFIVLPEDNPGTDHPMRGIAV